MDEKQFNDLVEKVGKEAAEKIKTMVADATKGTVTADQVKTMLSEFAPELKSIKIGEKNADEVLRDMGTQIAEMKKALDKGTNVPTKGLKEMLDEKMDAIQEVFINKSGIVKLDLKAAAVMTTQNVINENNLPDDILESFSVEAFVPKRRPRQYVYDIADRTIVQETTEYKTWLEEGGEEGAFAIVAEGGLKPLMSAALIRNISKVRKAAGKYVWTEEFAKFRKEAYRIIRQIITDKVVRDYDAIVTTSLLSASANYLGVALADMITNPTDYDAIGAVAAQIEAVNFMPDVLILNPQDKWRMALSKDLQGQYYINIPVVDPNGVTRMMGFEVRTSNYVPVGTFILGEANLFKIEQEALTMRMGYGINVTVNGSNVVTAVEHDLDHNRMRIIIEVFFHTWIASNHAGSFVSAQFNTVKAAIDSAV